MTSQSIVHAARERSALSDEFERIGPEVPTLCQGWMSQDLLAHLLLRERKLVPAVGILVPMLSGLTDRATQRYLSMPWQDMIRLFRSGLPAWSPLHIAGLHRLLNFLEFFAHHEDLRRTRSNWRPRPADPARDDALWNSLIRFAPVLYRRSPVGVTLQLPGGAKRVVKRGPVMVTVVGEPGELALHACGRTEIEVELVGNPSAVTALQTARIGV